MIVNPLLEILEYSSCLTTQKTNQNFFLLNLWTFPTVIHGAAYKLQISESTFLLIHFRLSKSYTRWGTTSVSDDKILIARNSFETIFL